MTEKIEFNLKYKTDPAWAEFIVQHFDPFLQDHANCERKASALAMSLVVKYADRTELVPFMIRLAQEELEHFRQVYALMEQRGLTLGKEIRDPYVNALVDLMRPAPTDRFVDRMLISSIIEARGAERFGLVAAALQDPELQGFYQRLWASEVKHGHLFANLLLHYCEREPLISRLEELLLQEADIVRALPWRPSLH